MRNIFAVAAGVIVAVTVLFFTLDVRGAQSLVEVASNLNQSVQTLTK